MLFFPNAKINIGLKVKRKRPDGYHDIETVFCPVAIHDMLEFVPNPSVGARQTRPDPSINTGKIRLTVTGVKDLGSPEDNLAIKAYHLLARDHALPPLSVHLHKLIPAGAGLGGGSSDAAFMLKNLNSRFDLGITEEELCEYASLLGSDCAFFIKNRPLLGLDRGNRFREIAFHPPYLEVIVVNPGIHVSTAEAYDGVMPDEKGPSLDDLIRLPLEKWKDCIINDFEASVFSRYPKIGALKDQMYAAGAVYASMSGSGSSVYGLFPEAPGGPPCKATDNSELFPGMFCWKGPLFVPGATFHHL